LIIKNIDRGTANVESLKNITLTPAEGTKLDYATEYNATLKANDGYGLPETIEVTVGEKVLEANKDYTYDAKTGALVINKGVVTDKVAIKANGALLNRGTVNTDAVTNLTFTPAKDAVLNVEAEYNATLKPVTGYALPETVEITAGEKVLEANKDYTYDAKTGAIRINKGVVTDDILITADGVLIEREENTKNLINIDISLHITRCNQY
jgi:stress response protein YsnF